MIEAVYDMCVRVAMYLLACSAQEYMEIDAILVTFSIPSDKVHLLC